MSRTQRGSKPLGYDYWGKRVGNKGGANGCSSYAKHLTHKRERVRESTLIRKETELGIQEINSNLIYDLKQDPYFRSFFPHAREIICHEHYILGEVVVEVDGVFKGYMSDYDTLCSFIYFTCPSYRDIDDLDTQYLDYLETNEKGDWLP